MRRQVATLLSEQRDYLQALSSHFRDQQRLPERCDNREILVDALGEARIEQSLFLLGIAVIDDPCNEVALWSALSMAKIGPVSVPVIEQLLNAKPAPRRVGYLVDALGRIGNGQARRVAEKCLAAPSLNAYRPIYERALDHSKLSARP